MRMRPQHTQESGISIVEILVALAVIAVMFGALVNLQLQNLRVSAASQKASSATQVANELLTEMTQEIFKPQTNGSLEEWIVYYYGCPATEPPMGAPYGCSGAGSVTASGTFDAAITAGIAGADQYEYAFTIRSLRSLASTTIENYLSQGLVAVTMTITGPSSTELTTLLSCLDASFTPQLQQGEPCPDPSVGG